MNVITLFDHSDEEKIRLIGARFTLGEGCAKCSEVLRSTDVFSQISKAFPVDFDRANSIPVNIL